MCHRNLLSVPDPPTRYPTTQVTESGIAYADPRGASWCGRMAEQSLLAG